MKEKIISDLGDNYNPNDEAILDSFIENYKTIASNESNRKTSDELLAPYIYTAVKQAYQRRGKESSTSNNEGGLSDSYIDIEDKLRKDVRAIRFPRV